MRVAIQAPISLLEDYCTLTGYQVCKPGLILDSRVYRDFFIHRRERKDYIILDCSDTEPRQSISPNLLVEATKILKPNLVVAPDYDVSSVKTVELTVAFLQTFGGDIRSLGVRLLGMVQGVTLEQCLFCYRNFSRLVDAIGLPRNIEVRVGRANLLKRIRTGKPIHIFGIHGNPEVELDSLLDLNRHNLFGVSTSLPVRLGFQCRLLDEYTPEPPRLDYHSSHNPYPDFTKNNIEDFIDLAGDLE